MSFATCPRCGTAHNPYQACEFMTPKPDVIEDLKVVTNVPNSVPNAVPNSRKTPERVRAWKQTHKEQVKAYQRTLMRKRRA